MEEQRHVLVRRDKARPFRIGPAVVLNGAAFGRDVRESGSAAAGEANTGQFVIALDVARFLPLDAFAAEIDRIERAPRL
jgi:LDH2 family malate/lactate/ureidoglycolate dehydrogenase